MSSDSAHQPLYIRGSNVAQASGDDDAFWRSLRERMTSCNANTPDDERAPPPEDDEFWITLQDRAASRIKEGANAVGGRGRENDEHMSANLVGYPQSPAEMRHSEESWLQGFADLDDANSDDDSFSSPFASHAAAPARKGVSFSSAIEVKTIPHRSSLSESQRQTMYNSSVEIHWNKIRNEKEFGYDGYDWRNATEEKDMRVDEVTGELIHPAHECELSFDWLPNNLQDGSGRQQNTRGLQLLGNQWDLIASRWKEDNLL